MKLHSPLRISILTHLTAGAIALAAQAFAARPPSVPTLDSRVLTLELQVKRLFAALQAQDAKITSLEATVAAQNGELTLLGSTSSSQSSQIAQLERKVSSQATEIGALRTEITSLETFSARQSEQLELLNSLLMHFSRVGNDLYIDGANLNIRNGTGHSWGDQYEWPPNGNGLGNLIVGYNEADSDQSHSGSHNLIIGPYHSYSSVGGLVSGYRSTVSGAYASVSGGIANTAHGECSSISGGSGNKASDYSSISGGYNNATICYGASVSGGEFNTAWFEMSSISGGCHNIANGWSASVSGGYYNEANGDGSSVSGGYRRSTPFGEVGYYDWVAGALHQDDCAPAAKAPSYTDPKISELPLVKGRKMRSSN
jgi:trimeric autotransporter adhesin